MTDEISTKKIVVHVLDQGRPLCGFSEDSPKDWPSGNFWVSLYEAKERPNCPECIKREEELKNQARS